MKAQEEELGCRHKYLFLLRYEDAIISQKYEKYATHSQKTHISSNKLDKYTTHNAQIVQTRKVNKTKRRVDECQSAKIC